MTANLETIYNDFHGNLRRFVLGRVSDADVADDILQDIYLRIHTHIGELRDSERLESWIYQITRNVIIDFYRRSRPQAELSELLPAPEADEDSAMTELGRSVYDMLGCLPEMYKQALILTEIQGLTQVELAGWLGLSISGAKSRVQRAREMLKEAFLDCCHFEFDRLGKVIDYYPRCERCASQSRCE